LTLLGPLLSTTHNIGLPSFQPNIRNFMVWVVSEGRQTTGSRGLWITTQKQVGYSVTLPALLYTVFDFRNEIGMGTDNKGVGRRRIIEDLIKREGIS
jgi:hypothetical protein